MQNTPLVRYALDLPEAILDKVRLLSAKRKVEKHAQRTQRAIIIELLETGLFMLEPSNGSQSTSNSATV